MPATINETGEIILNKNLDDTRMSVIIKKAIGQVIEQTEKYAASAQKEVIDEDTITDRENN